MPAIATVNATCGALAPKRAFTFAKAPILGFPTIASGSSVTIPITAPADSGGYPLLEYIITSNPVTTTRTIPIAGSYVFTGLTPGTLYTFSARTRTAYGTGSGADYSSSSSSVTPNEVPGAPTGVTVTATGTSKQLTVSWSAPTNNGTAITNYYVDYSASSTFASGVTTVNTSSTNTSRTITDAGWTNGTAVYFRIRAENAYGQSANGPSINYPFNSPYTNPSAITGMTAARQASQTVRLTFAAPASNGRNITNYQYTYKTPTQNSGNYVAWINTNSTSTTIDVAGLTNALQYTFKVRAETLSGVYAADSNEPSATPDTLADAPTSVSAVATGTSKQITVSWNAPTNNGSAIIQYHIDYSPVSDLSSSVSTTTSVGTSKTITDNGWTNGTIIYFRVRAENSLGQGPNSIIVNDFPYTPPTFGTQTGSSTEVAPTVGSTTVSSRSTTTATLGISGVSGGTVYDYERTGGTGGTSPSAASLTGLSEKTTYTWRSRMTNNSSNQSLVTRVTPNGSTSTVSVKWGTSSGSYPNTATVSSGTSSIGASNDEQSTTWSLSSSTSSTIYYQITVTYRGDATVVNTGSISRAVSTYYGSSVTFNTYGTYTYTSSSTLSVLDVRKPTNGVDITNITISLVGGGGGGTSNGGLGAGGGGAGQYVTATIASANNNILAERGAGGAGGQYGGLTSFIYPTGQYYAYGGTPAVGTQGGASPRPGGQYYYGAPGNSSAGGGGGGAGGNATSVDGGPSYFGAGPGGPGYYNYGQLGSGNGAWGSGGSQSSFGAGGAGGALGSGGTGANGGFTVTYTGPHREGGAVGD